MQTKNAEPEFEVLWPLGKKAVRAKQGAARLPDLSGKTVAELWDYIFHGEVIYPMIREHLRSRYPGVRFVDYSNFGNFHGPKGREIVAGLAAKLRSLGCDAVISGIGA